MSTHRYGFSIGPDKPVTYVGDLPKAVSVAQAALWDTRVQGDRAHIYRDADGPRFVGYVMYDGRFVDERVTA